MFEKQYLLDCFYKVVRVPIHVLDSSGTILYAAISDKDEDIYQNDPDMCQWIMNESNGKASIIHEQQVIYGVFWHGNTHCYVIGPCRIGTLDIFFRRNFCKKHHLETQKLSLSETTLPIFSDILILFYYAITGEEINATMLLKNSGKENVESPISEKEEFLYQYEKSEQEQERYNFEKERDIFQEIRNGSPMIWGRDADFAMLERIGKMAANDYKKLEYMVVTSVTLATRAAIEGGLNASAAYDLSDLYLQKLETCRDKIDILKLHCTMMQDFSNRVAEVKKAQREASDYIEKCKNYLVRNMHHKIKLADIAKVMGVNASYLSRRFSEEVGMTMVDYLTKERLKGAANMLKYSDFSCAEIAEYFCFSSQSRFGEQFKKVYDVTPAQYRKENQIQDFK